MSNPVWRRERWEEMGRCSPALLEKKTGRRRERREGVGRDGKETGETGRRRERLEGDGRDCGNPIWV